MDCSRTKRRSTSTILSDNDAEYQTDSTSIEGDARNESRSRPDLLSDDGFSENELGRPPEYYRAHASQVNNTKITKFYADSTILQFNAVESQWRRYCAHIGEDPEELMNSLSLGDVSSFFTWKLDQKRGAAGRRLRGIKEASSLGTFRKMFLRVYRKLVGRDMDSEMSRGTHNVAVKLARDYDLSHTPREKPPMDAQDVLEITQTALTTVEKMFKVGRYRIQTCFFILGGFITANRPRALLGLRYRDIKVTILRNPNGGPHNILLEWTYEFTKSFLGPKAPNTFPIPEIIFDPSLVLSPHVFLLGLMFADKAFSISELTPENLYTLDIRPGCNQLNVPIREEVADLCVFRRYTQTATKLTISDEQLSYATVKTHMQDVGEITGFKAVAKPYCLRYGAANAFDKDGNTSDALRNLIMKHHSADVFLNHYLNPVVRVDTQAIVRGLAPQEELMQAACRMSRWIDPERPRFLTPEQSQSVDQHPQIRKLLRQQQKLNSKLSPEYKELQRNIRNEKQRLRHALIKSIRQDYDRTRAEKDIRQQLSGGTFGEKIKTDLRRCSERTLLHRKLIESIISLPGSCREEEIRRRSTAIERVAAYCHFEEGETSRNHGPRETVDMDEVALKRAKDVFIKEKRPRVCFVCLGNEALTVKKRVYEFSSPGDLTKHFKRHLRGFNKSTGEQCNLCETHLEKKTDMQLHAYVRHGTCS
ncbi:hypothetical protein AA0119_g13215 [Alternaria tenuissima]|uniref:C2H2-type domain-containing protein n=1 Tax=Alternaria tenuissima TaxID=119927 RepID=A0ABY0FP70_9PLEO|nr:hypothetical protein AA0119_g13215 [Alternaria tenuissima]